MWNTYVYRVRVRMSNASINNVSDISWRSVLLMKDIRVSSRSQTLSHNAVSCTLRLNKIWTHNVSGYRQWLQSYYHTITTTMIPQCLQDNHITIGNHRANILGDYIVHLIKHKKNIAQVCIAQNSVQLYNCNIVLMSASLCNQLFLNMNICILESIFDVNSRTFFLY